jgi:hypothetical protein
MIILRVSVQVRLSSLLETLVFHHPVESIEVNMWYELDPSPWILDAVFHENGELATNYTITKDQGVHMINTLMSHNFSLETFNLCVEASLRGTEDLPEPLYTLEYPYELDSSATSDTSSNGESQESRSTPSSSHLPIPEDEIGYAFYAENIIMLYDNILEAAK